MSRCMLPALLAGLFIWSGLVLAQEAHTIKLKELAAGDSVQVERTETVKSTTLIVDGEGKKLVNRSDVTVETTVFKETIVQREGKKHPTKLERAYTKAEFKVGDVPTDLPYSGKTVVIEKKEGKYVFSIKGGAELKGAAAQLLDKEFNRSTDDNKLEKRLLPLNAVKMNETWPLDMVTVLKPWQKSGDMGFDTAKASGTGKLHKVYQQNGKPFGELQYGVKIPLVSLGKGKEQLKLQAGSYASFDVTMDVCIDGTTDASVVKSKTDLFAKATVPAPKGGTADFSLTVLREVRETRKELPKK